MSRIKRHLSMLRFGQAVQMLFGFAVVLFAVAFWRHYWQEPAMLATAIVMHVYGVMVIGIGGQVQVRISGVDRSLPVLEIQKRLAALSRGYVIGGIWVGLPWVLLWVLCAVMLARAAAGVNLYETAPLFVYLSLAIGLLIVFGVRWSQSPANPERAKRFEASLSGGSIRRSQAILDEIAKFEGN